ncbi:uncharacterized protein LOC121048421 [Ixodes scapularis]|uniref:uncharacterized protein LOC121048421 n=1 Tax=Ixodes scapularis TaxID=6945 RepID=UPI001AD7BE01|nr:uncharacterized protein LOC121048421 [Ixodes scapularis]
MLFLYQAVNPVQATGVQSSMGYLMLFNMNYLQTAVGALNLVEVSLAVLIFNSLCISSEASHSELLFVASFTYSVTGFYFFLNGVLNRSSPSARQPTITLVSQLLLYHSVGGLVFLLGGAYTLAQHLSVPLALVSGTLAVIDAGIHTSHAVYIYRGDFRYWLEQV